MPIISAPADVVDARNDLIFLRLRFLLFYAAVLYPLFFFMDWKERPWDWPAALGIRLSVTAIMLLLVRLSHTSWGRPKALLCATAGFLIGHAGFAAIVWHARGFGSSNRDDFELFFGTYCVLVPTTTLKAAIVGAAMICIQLTEYALSGTVTHYDDVVWNAVPFLVIFLTARHVSNLIEIEWRKEFVWARDLEKANEKLVATQNTLVRSEKLAALGQVTAEIAHELNNPLTGITDISQVAVAA
jgi:signal transduction histidine kinase